MIFGSRCSLRSPDMRKKRRGVRNDKINKKIERNKVFVMTGCEISASQLFHEQLVVFSLNINFTIKQITVRWTLANIGEGLLDFRQLAKVLTFTGERSVEIRQLAKIQDVYWRKTSGHSPMARVQFAKFLLANFRLPFRSIHFNQQLKQKTKTIN